MNTTKTTAADRLNLYTGFPFKLGGCGELQDVILLDEWVFENNGRFLENANLFPAKVPNNFNGCPIKLGTFGIDPFVIMKENYTQNDGRTAYKLTGLSVDILKFVCEKMNLTTVFLAPLLNLSFESGVKSLSELDEGLSDLLSGIIPLLPIVMTSSFDATIPYMFANIKFLVPCPKIIPGNEKVLATFSLSVWLTIGLVLLLTTAVFWCAGNSPYRYAFNETHSYRSLSNCFHNAWAVFVAVSVPQQPTSSSLRVFFFLYVCFCFAISTVFQAFFVSYLVEPTYEKKLETLDDLQNSEVFYGHHPIFDIIKGTAENPELEKFLQHKKLKEDCNDLMKCFERMITQRDIAALFSPPFATYVARKMGTVNVGNIICSLDETFFSGVIVFLFKKGSPLQDKFNILMRRYLEAGFLEQHWTELQHQASLMSGKIFRVEGGDVFFAFSLSQLMPAFVVLLVGTVLSSLAFIGELIVNCFCKRRIKKEIRLRRGRLLNLLHHTNYRF